MKTLWKQAIILAVVFVTTPALADVTFEDPLGEIPFAQSDITNLQVGVSEGRLLVTIFYGEEVGLTDSNYGTLFIDADRNPDTGIRMGADVILWYTYTGVYSGGYVNINHERFDIGDQGTLLTTGVDFIRFSLPLSLLGGREDPLLFVASSWIFGNTFYDRVPDAGFLDAGTGLSVIPRPGNGAIHLRVSDPAGDAFFPDITGLEFQVAEGNLRVWLTFAHGVEKADLTAAQDVMVINLHMDLDKRLWTGFANAHEEPPTFGIDRTVSLMLSDLFSVPQGTLKMRPPDDPATPLDDLSSELIGIGLGRQENDTRLVVGKNDRFHTAANTIFISIPLSYLGYDDGDMVVMAETFLQSTLTPGHADSLPDSGALDTKPGLLPAEILRPVASCVSSQVTGTDPADDSLGFGLQGDEIISSRACALDSGGLMISVDLESLAYDDLAYLNLFVDRDNDPWTGIALVNGTPEIAGADFYLCMRIAPVPDPTIVTTLLVEFGSPPLGSGIHRVDHLVSLRTGGTLNSEVSGGHYTLTLPPEILGGGTQGTVKYVITATQQSFTNENGVTWKNEDGTWEAGLGQETAFLSPQGVPSLLDTAPNLGFFQAPAPAPPSLWAESITPSRGTPAGGTPVTVFGKGFERGVGVQVGTTLLLPEDMCFLSSGGVALVTPGGSPGPADLLLSNPVSGETFEISAVFLYADPLVGSPRISGVEPDLGPLSGGGSVQITGTNFISGAGVAFGGAPASAMVISAFEITAVVPPGDIGPVDIQVVNPDGSSGGLERGYNYGSRPPGVWSLFPVFGPLSGGTRVTLAGDRFQAGAVVEIGGIALSDLQVVSPRLLVGTTQAMGTPGWKAISVTNPDGVGTVKETAFLWGGTDPGLSPPGLLGGQPLSSPTSGGVLVTISGYDFQAGLTVFFDGVPVPVEHFDGSGLIQVTAPSHGPGMVEIKVVNPDAKAVSFPADQPWNSFTYDSGLPTISMVYTEDYIHESPTTGGKGVTISGSNFRPGAHVAFGGNPAVVTDVSPIAVTVITPPHEPGPVDITVTNPGGLTGVYTGDIIWGDFTYVGSPPPGPVVTSLNPDFGSLTGGEMVSISGSGFFSGARLFFGPFQAEIEDHVSPSLIQARLPRCAMGIMDVTVINADGQEGGLPGGFTAIAPLPVVNDVEPGTGPCAGGTFVTIQGEGFLPESLVRVGGNPAAGLRFVDETILTATMPPGFPGTVAVEVINPGDQAGTLAGAYTFQGESAPLPQLFTLFPSSGPQEGGIRVEMIGQGILSGASLTVGTQPMIDPDIVSTTTLTMVIPPGEAGAWDVTLTNADGGSAVLPESFVYIDPLAPSPQVDSVLPATGPAAGGTPIVVSGAHFQPGAQVYLGDLLILEPSRLFSGEITGTTPAHPAGAVEIRVVNPDGKEGTLSQGFTYDLPSWYPFDKDQDGDVDGKDLALCIQTGSFDVAAFAEEFGRLPP
ncbi:MAG: IPT/TIG domain-containing protein [Desulfobacterium sp.]|nr:IPT/TIG domain-containing protein [Desulfobacterium sp.]